MVVWKGQWFEAKFYQNVYQIDNLMQNPTVVVVAGYDRIVCGAPDRRSPLAALAQGLGLGLGGTGRELGAHRARVSASTDSRLLRSWLVSEGLRYTRFSMSGGTSWKKKLYETLKMAEWRSGSVSALPCERPGFASRTRLREIIPANNCTMQGQNNWGNWGSPGVMKL